MATADVRSSIKSITIDRSKHLHEEPRTGHNRWHADVEPVIELRDTTLTWYVGLDAEGTRVGDMLWNGDELEEAARARVIGLFRLRFRERDVVAEKFAGEPVYLILAMTADNLLRMKPQNLVTGLPVRHTEAAT